MALAVTLLAYGPAYYFCLEQPNRLGDFFQEWASARNYFEGLPIYAPQSTTAWRYLQQRPDPTKQVFVQINGHPPACVVAALPLGKLDYAPALRLWNGLSLVALVGVAAAVLRWEVGTLRTWLWLPLAVILLGNSLVQHVILGQLGIWLLALIVGAAIADDRRRPVLAGVLLGTATALKLFPGFLFLYFLLMRKWRTLAAGAAAFVVWNLVGVALFSAETYRHYVRYAMPEVLRYRDWWANFSVTGFWYKLFDGSSGQTVPLLGGATIAQLGTWLTTALLIGAAALAVYRARGDRAAERSALALLIVVMVLIAPIVWDHYFLLLMWPLVRLAVRLQPSAASRITLLTALFFFWLNPLVLFMFATRGAGVATAEQILTLVSWPFYALLVVFALTWTQTVRETAAARAAVQRPQAEGGGIVGELQSTAAN